MRRANSISCVAAGLAVALLIPLAAGAAAGADRVGGTFRYGELTLQPADLWAYASPDPIAPWVGAVTVLVADFALDKEALAASADRYTEARDQARAKNGAIVELVVRPDGDTDLYLYFAAATESVDMVDRFGYERPDWKSAAAPRVEGRYATAEGAEYGGRPLAVDLEVAAAVAPASESAESAE
jgi:hypothetical protein